MGEGGSLEAPHKETGQRPGSKVKPLTWEPQRVGLPGTEDPLASYLTGLEVFKGMTESACFI